MAILTAGAVELRVGRAGLKKNEDEQGARRVHPGRPAAAIRASVAAIEAQVERSATAAPEGRAVAAATKAASAARAGWVAAVRAATGERAAEPADTRPKRQRPTWRRKFVHLP